MKTEEGNKLIAIFMGGRYVYKENVGTQVYNKQDRHRIYGLKQINTYHMVRNLEYHSSWDWLMPVVEEIESLGWTVVIEKGLCHIFSDKTPYIDDEFANKSNGNITPKIELAYKTAVEFITWYNKNTNPLL